MFKIIRSNKRWSKQEKEQRILSMTICLLVSYQPILLCISILCGYIVGEGFIYDSFLCYMVLFLYLFKSFCITTKKVKADILLIFIGILAAYCLTYLFFNENREYMFSSFQDIINNPFYILFVYSFSGYLLIRYINNYEIFLSYLEKISISVVICSIATMLILNGQDSQPEYMTFSYNMLLQTALLFLLFFETKRWKLLVIAASGGIAITIAGARGPLICLAATIIVYILFGKMSWYKKILLITVMAASTGAISLNFIPIIIKLKRVAMILNMNSRTLDKIILGSFFDDSGRRQIIDRIIERMTIFGLGLYGDRAVTGGTYAHNFLVEVIAQWGYILGMLLLMVVLAYLFRGIRCKHREMRMLIIVFLSTGFFKLFLSGSYLNQEPAFYILLGLCVNTGKMKRSNIGIHSNKTSEVKNEDSVAV